MKRTIDAIVPEPEGRAIVRRRVEHAHRVEPSHRVEHAHPLEQGLPAPAMLEAALWSAAAAPLASGGPLASGNSVAVPPVAPVAAPVAAEEEEYPSSDDEEFMSLDHYFELRDSDRVNMFEELPEVADGMEVARGFQGHWRGILAVRLRGAYESECYRRREMYKLFHRFMSRTSFKAGFLRFVERLFPRSIVEDLNSWFSRLRACMPVLFWKLCVLHDLDHQFELNLEMLPASLSSKLREYLALDVVRKLDDKHRSMARAVRNFDEMVEEGTEADVEASRRRVQLLCNMACKYMSELLSRQFVPKLYRFELLTYLDRESQHIWRCVQEVLGKVKLSASSPAGHLLYRFLAPDYSLKPVRGPFRAGYEGFSQLSAMYGATPDRQFYYCNCVSNGAYCSHPPMSHFLQPRVSVVDDEE